MSSEPFAVDELDEIGPVVDGIDLYCLQDFIINTATGKNVIVGGQSYAGVGAGFLLDDVSERVYQNDIVIYSRGDVSLRTAGGKKVSFNGTDFVSSGAGQLLDKQYSRVLREGRNIYCLGNVTINTAAGKNVQINDSLVAGCNQVLLENFNNNTNWGGAGGIVAGRNGTAIQTTGSGSSSRYYLPVNKVSPYITMGFAYRVSDVGAATRHILTLESDAAATNQITLRLNTDGSLSPLRGGTVGAVLGTTSVGLLTTNTWAYIELQVYMHDTAGWLKLRVNGTEYVNISAVDTRFGGGPNIESIILLGPGTAQNAQYDDMYITAGPSCSFKGDTVVP